MTTPQPPALLDLTGIVEVEAADVWKAGRLVARPSRTPDGVVFSSANGYDGLAVATTLPRERAGAATRRRGAGILRQATPEPPHPLSAGCERCRGIQRDGARALTHRRRPRLLLEFDRAHLPSRSGTLCEDDPNAVDLGGSGRSHLPQPTFRDLRRSEAAELPAGGLDVEALRHRSSVDRAQWTRHRRAVMRAGHVRWRVLGRLRFRPSGRIAAAPRRPPGARVHWPAT